MKKNILLIFGGGGTEHQISLISSAYLEKTLDEIGDYNIIKVEIKKDKSFWKIKTGNKTEEAVEINFLRQLVGVNKEDLHLAIPCIHGPPGETGEIQTFFELIGLPYLGCRPEASILAFNKASNKLWLNALSIPNTPFIFLTDINQREEAHHFFDRYGKVFIKAASQGSSIGCFPVFQKEKLDQAIKEAFAFSSYVLVEKMLNARELEISTYQFEGKIFATGPGEIRCPSQFYSYQEKYDPNSKTTTQVVALNLPPNDILKMKEYALAAFRHLKLRHLSRIDFFYTDQGEIFLNEINTFPGMTPISMFPKMMENNGHSFKKFLNDLILENIL